MAANRFTGMKATATGLAVGVTILASAWFYTNQPANASDTSTATGAPVATSSVAASTAAPASATAKAPAVKTRAAKASRGS